MNYDELILQEVSAYAPKKLRNIEATIAKLKKSTNNKTARSDFITQIKDFTKIKEVILIFNKDDFNAGVIPVYKSSTVFEILREFINEISGSKDWDKLEPKLLKKVKTVEESSEMVERIYLFIGKPLLKVLTPTEMTAVLLHELGHVYSTTTQVPYATFSFLKTAMVYGRFVNFILANLLKIVFFREIFFLYLLVSTVFIHGITFTERTDELRADNFVLKYGYGDEFISALTKFTGTRKVNKSSIKNMIKNFLNRIFNLLRIVFMPESYTHPSGEKRIKNLEKQIFDKYRDIYPDYREILDQVQADYSKQGA